jgi:F-type H+-transporting ATPase subunit b
MQLFENIGINGWNLVAQLVAFVIFILLFWRFALKPIVTALDRRTERIRESYAAADAMRAELQATEARNEQLLQQARQEAQQIVANARQAGEASLARARDEASKQADDYLGRAQETLRQETNQARQQLRQEIADLAVTAATRIVRREIDPAAQSQIIRDTLAEAERPTANRN